MLRNISVSEFKRIEGVDTVQIVRNPNTTKLFASVGNGKNYRVEAAIDTAKPVEFLYDDDATLETGGIENGCFINQRANNVVATL
jgi:hypothetical protein